MPRYVAGKIPFAGTRSAASFARRRAREFISPSFASNVLKPSAFIPMQSTRWIPATATSPAGPKRVAHLFEEFPAFGLLPSITAGAQVRLATRYDRFGKKTQLVDIKAFKGYLNRILAIAGLPHIGARFLVWHVGRWSMMEMVYLTPVETGTAAAGWTISPQIRGGGKGYGRVGFRISNPVSYIIHLEYGHSDKAPEGMQRITFLRARHHLHALLDWMIFWWKGQQHTLRNLKFDWDMAGGRPYDPAQVERKIPPLTWQRLVNELKARLPLNRDISHLNAEAFLAMRIDDPKNWHTVHEFQEPGHVFETRLVPFQRERDVVNEFDISSGHPLRTVRTEHYTEHVVEHVVGEATPSTGRSSLSSQAAELERIWRGQK